MANDIYTTTLGGLTELVSKRVAEGVLDRALSAAGADADHVDARTMSRLLRGRVRRELERSLPRAGLRRSLAELDARIAPHETEQADAGSAPSTSPRGEAGEPASDVAPSEGAPLTWRHEPADDAELPVRKHAFPIAEDEDVPPEGTAPETAPEATAEGAALEGTAPEPDASPRPTALPAVEGRAVEPPTSATPVPASPAVTSTFPSPTPQVPTSPMPVSAVRAGAAGAAAPAAAPAPIAAIARLAEQEGVRQWVWASPHRGVDGRGEGPEPARVAADVRTVLTLLERHGRVKSLRIRHGAGEVLIGVAGPSALVIAGREGINVGSIYATFRALEEET